MPRTLQTYLQEIANINPSDKEYTYRPALKNLFDTLIEHLAIHNKALQTIHIMHEPNNDKEGRGAPDFLVQTQGLILGYIENKRVNSDLDSLAKSPQIEKYLRLSDNLMLTDYLRFCLVRKDSSNQAEIIAECRICDLSQLKATLKDKPLLESKAKALQALFTLFYTHSPKPIITALEFANALALRTQILKDSLIQSQENPHITSLYETFKETLYKELDFTEFADSFAQTLTYSLFLARLNNESGKEIDLYNVKAFIPKSFPLLRAMSGFLDNLEELDSIKWLIKEILYIINHIDIANIIKELNKAGEKDLLGTYTTQFTHKDPYLHFYETFLSQYDPKLRELRGVYYTPASVVNFIINAIDSVLKSDFTLTKGKGLRAALDEKNLTLLDFATGTGTFLLEAFRKALESIPKGSTDYNPKVLLKRFYGFEYLIAPYTIAHLKISQAFKEEFDTPLSDNDSLNIRLTNTLYFNKEKDELNKQNENLFLRIAGIKELAEEFKKAQKIKQDEILIITGNPPYNANSINKYNIEDYKYCGIDKNKKRIYINEKKHRLNDDYIKFIRFAQNKIDTQESGLIALITNNSFLDGATMNGMRWNLLNAFDKIYLLNLHGDSNKQEQSPDGSKDENIFDIKQGVSVSIFVKTKAKKSLSNTPKCKVFYYDLYGSRKHKNEFLYQQSLDSITWQSLKPQFPHYEFFIQTDKMRSMWNSFLSLKDIFIQTGLGICTYRDSFCYADSKEALQKRIETFSKQESEKIGQILSFMTREIGRCKEQSKSL